MMDGLENVSEEEYKSKGKANYECDKCNKVFGRKFTLQMHFATHSAEYGFECSKCLKKFKIKHSMRRHMKLHEPLTKSLACELCEKKFSRKELIKAHMKNKHSERVALICDICDKVLLTHSGMKRHKLTHSDPSFECDVCHYRTHWKEVLRKHMMSHVPRHSEPKL